MLAPNVVSALFRLGTGLMSFGVFSLTVGALYFKFSERIWQKKSHSYVHLLFLTFLLSFAQTVAAVVDILWLLNYGEHGWDFHDNCEAVNATVFEEKGCWIRRVDASVNYISLCLMLVMFLVVTFFFLRLAVGYMKSKEQAQDSQGKLRLPYFASVGWVGLLLLFALSGVQPKAFTCDDPVWGGLLVSEILLLGLVLSLVRLMYSKRTLQHKNQRIWRSLVHILSSMVLAALVAIAEALNNIFQGGDAESCLPIDASYAALSHKHPLSAVVAGGLHLAGQALLFLLPSMVLLRLYRSDARQAGERLPIGRNLIRPARRFGEPCEPAPAVAAA